MKHPFYLLFIFLITGIFAIIVTVSEAQARPVPKAAPKAREMTKGKSRKLNSNERPAESRPPATP